MKPLNRLVTISLCFLAGGCVTWLPAMNESVVPAPAAKAPAVSTNVGAKPVPVAAVKQSAAKLPAPKPAPRQAAPSPAPAEPEAENAAPDGQELPEVPAVIPVRTIMAIQAFLDRQNFSCNCIDGKIGPRTKQAIAAWQTANGMAASGKVTPELLERMSRDDKYFATHTVSTNELDALTDVPETWPARAAATRLGYRTVLETLAEKFHASEGALRGLNPNVPWPDPPAGTLVVVPNPLPGTVARAARATIRLSAKTVYLYDAADRLIAVLPCSIAAKMEKRPVGDLKIVNAASNPEYLFDPALFSEDPEASAMPGKRMIAAGPNNPVGVAWVSLDRPGYGMHGTPHPEDIGKTESHGCFRLANWNARKLLNMVSVGMPVRVEP